ncbi:MAG TPA: hypothetical protein VMU18_05110 [Rhodoblastus sp.]|nr:hypothetical protein [Rhodoblastus sp.]
MAFAIAFFLPKVLVIPARQRRGGGVFRWTRRIACAFYRTTGVGTPIFWLWRQFSGQAADQFLILTRLLCVAKTLIQQNATFILADRRLAGIGCASPAIRENGFKSWRSMLD